MKIAYLVLGPEGSGTRMLTEVFVRAGIWGQYIHDQQMDNMDFSSRPDKIVFRRSLPHNNIWPEVANIIMKMQVVGYQVVPVIIYRERYMCAQSQMRMNLVPDIVKAYEHMDRAASILAWETARYNPIILSYEKFVTNKKYREHFYITVEIGTPSIAFYNGNDKYR